jgi:hypothetical protein
MSRMMITARQVKLMVPEGIMNVVVEVLVNQRVLMATPDLVLRVVGWGDRDACVDNGTQRSSPSDSAYCLY